MPVRLPALRRDHVIAASLAGAVVVVVGYASGIGLRPGTSAEATPPADGGQQQAAPAVPGAGQPVPGALPPPDSVPPLPAVPVLPVAAQPPDPTPPMEPMPPMPPQSPGGVVVTPTPGPGPEQPPPPATTPPLPPPGTTPPGTPVPVCQPGVPQQLLDTVGGIPLLGTLTTGLGVTGPNGLTEALLGHCATQAAGW
ncbi:hypothetical protein [Amycolatopsis sp. CA-230715]|uniref:hypothetical protein n=1 Tax=Amycolatopsis sp. CA-230715 TaxID=2745196 RepID=UPI001C01477B|nr:hypothetical protein [Amycolatopsis sp. CA-230715]